MFWCCAAESSDSTAPQLLVSNTESYADSAVSAKTVGENGGTFEVALGSITGQLGLELDMTDATNGPMIASILDGHVQDFNRKNPGQALKVYDRIAKVNGRNGTSVELQKLLASSQGPVQLQIVRPQERTTILHKTGELGINLHYKKNSTGIVIKDIIDGGMLAKHNAENPEAQVVVGDRIVGFSGEAMKGTDLVKKLQESSILTLTVMHY